MVKNINITSTGFDRLQFNIPDATRVSRAALIKSSITVGKLSRKRVISNSMSIAGLSDALIRVLRVSSYIDFSNREYLFHSEIFNNMDASEKRNASYELGMIFCKLMAERYLNYAFLVHYSLLEKMGRARRLTKSKSTPDLIGFNKIANTIGSFEAKGSCGRFNNKVYSKAKKQSCAAIDVDSMTPSLRVASYQCVNDSNKLEYLWHDPENDDVDPELLISTPNTWREYYSRVFALYEYQSNQESWFADMFGFRLVLSRPLLELRKVLSGSIVRLQTVNILLSEIQKLAMASEEIAFSKAPYVGLDGITIIDFR